MGAYCPSKAAIASFARVLALEEAANGVRANVVSPGGICTDLVKKEFPEGTRWGNKERHFPLTVLITCTFLTPFQRF